MFASKEIQEVLQELKTNRKNGLSTTEAKERLAKDGYNELAKVKKDTLFIKFINQIKDPLIIVLIIAAAVSMIVDPHEWVDTLVIIVVVIFNAILGIMQENNAENSLEELKKMSAPQAKVWRNKEKIVISSKELVVGDIVILEAGDYIASDGRLIESYNLQVDESSLTGESIPVKKQIEKLAAEVELADQTNMVFASCVCTYGRGIYVVTSTGMNNQVGKIASMLMENKKEITPLQIRLMQISKMIGVLCLVICLVVFGMELLSGLSLIDSFKTAVALAVAAIPEGLATVVTVVLAIGVKQMVKHKAIVRKLPAVETLGSASIVCSDKTGTLTQNKMTVVSVYRDGKLSDFKADEATAEIKELMRYFTLCTDGEVRLTADHELQLIGDPTETSLVEASYHLNDTKEKLAQEYTRVAEIAFDSVRKMMTVFYKYQGKYIAITKGATDEISKRVKNNMDFALEINTQLAEQALRVLAVAIREYDELPKDITSENCEKDLTFIGLAAMIDPPRKEAKQAIIEAKKGGIRSIMITGDHIITAKAIATQLGILEDGQIAITGSELAKMSDSELKAKLADISVYARVAPEHKVRIVKMWQEAGNVVAMTGDGVNDSPALKTADIGCAMGITGCDVAKGAADMILMDDNFATIINAVKQGRGIYTNIKKDVQYLLSSNIGEVLVIFLASLLGLMGFDFAVPLLPIHLLWINLISDSFPAFAIGLEPISDEVMLEKPRPKNESFFAHNLGFTILWQGLMIGLITLVAYVIGNRYNYQTAMSMAFMTLAFTQLLHAFNVKSEHSIFHKTIFNNKYLWYTLILGICLQLMIMYVPALQMIFKLTPLSLNLLARCFALASLVIIIVEMIKNIQRLKRKLNDLSN